MTKNAATLTPTVAIEKAAREGQVILSGVLYRAFDEGRIAGTKRNNRILLDAASFDRWLKALTISRDLRSHYRANRNTDQAAVGDL